MMRRFVRHIFMCLLIFLVGRESLLGRINWGSKDSGILVGQHAVFHVGERGMEVGGTFGLMHDEATLEGNPVVFSSAILDKNGHRVLLNAEYIPASEDTAENIYLHGNAVLWPQSDVAFENILVDGVDNQIRGPIAVSAITLQDASAALDLGCHKQLSSIIRLNGGQLRLLNDVSLSKDARIVGPGLIDKQGYKLLFPAGKEQIISSDIIFSENSIAGMTNSGLFADVQTDNALIAHSDDAGDMMNLGGGTINVTFASPLSIERNIVIDGGHGTIAFDGLGSSDVGFSQSLFTVADGMTVRLQNVTLSNITQQTFNFGTGSILELGENVLLEFGDDTALNAGLLKIVSHDGVTPNVVQMRGINGKKILQLSPADVYQSAALDLNNNSILLQNLEMIGTRFIEMNGDRASIALAGDAVIDVSTSNAFNIDVEGSGNVLALSQDGLTLSGALRFNGFSAENSLAIKFVLSSPVGAKTVSTVDPQGNLSYINVKKGNPLVIFDGNIGVYLSNEDRQAKIIFEDPSVSIVNGLNLNTNGFVLGKGSLLIADELEVLGHPLKQTSAISTSSVKNFVGVGSRIIKDYGLRLRPHETAYSQWCAKKLVQDKRSLDDLLPVQREKGVVTFLTGASV